MRKNILNLSTITNIKKYNKLLYSEISMLFNQNKDMHARNYIAQRVKKNEIIIINIIIIIIIYMVSNFLCNILS